MVFAVPQLLELHAVITSLPFEWVMFLHCLFAASLAPEMKHAFLIHYWLTFAGGFGGGTISAFLLGRPDKAWAVILTNPIVGVAFTAAWWLINYCPGDYVNKLHEVKYVKAITKAASNLLRVQTIIARVTQSVEFFPNVLVAPLILGTLGGCGGKLCMDAIRGAYGTLKAPAELTAPGPSWRSSALAAAWYYLVVFRYALLGSREASALLIFFIVLHSVMSDIMGHPMDWTQPPFALFHRLTFIPAPSGSAKAPKPQKAKAAAGAAEDQEKPAAAAPKRGRSKAADKKQQ